MLIIIIMIIIIIIMVMIIIIIIIITIIIIIMLIIIMIIIMIIIIIITTTTIIIIICSFVKRHKLERQGCQKTKRWVLRLALRCKLFHVRGEKNLKNVASNMGMLKKFEGCDLRLLACDCGDRVLAR